MEKEKENLELIDNHHSIKRVFPRVFFQEKLKKMSREIINNILYCIL